MGLVIGYNVLLFSYRAHVIGTQKLNLIAQTWIAVALKRAHVVDRRRRYEAGVRRGRLRWTGRRKDASGHAERRIARPLAVLQALQRRRPVNNRVVIAAKVANRVLLAWIAFAAQSQVSGGRDLRTVGDDARQS